MTADRTAGHRELLERMVCEQPRRLPNKMHSSVRDRDLADDLSQEALILALRSLASIRGPAEEALVCGWLDSIAVNVLKNHRRSAARKPDIHGLEESEARLDSTSGPFPEDAVVAAQTRQVVQGLIQGLPEDLREVFVRRVVQEQSTAEVAGHLGISPELVRWRLHRARTILREQLEPQG